MEMENINDAIAELEKIKLAQYMAQTKWRQANRGKCCAYTKKYYDAHKDDPEFKLKARMKQKQRYEIIKRKKMEVATALAMAKAQEEQEGATPPEGVATLEEVSV